jgi:hypothetical protein
LTVEDRNGEYTGMLKTRTFNVIMITKEKTGAQKVINYTGAKTVVPLSD